MKTIPRVGLLVLSAALAGCGGGGSSTAGTTPVSCSLALQYANGYSSGIAISPTATSADRTFSSCNPTQISSVTLNVCVDHPAIAELSGRLLLAGTAISALQPASGTAQGTSCLASTTATTSLRQFVLNSPDMHGLSTFAGPWTVEITDTNQNNLNGYFVAWSLDLQGTR